MVTLYDVARVAGVSTATVSRVVHGQDLVRDSTRARVLEVIEQLGYVPDGAAQSLSRRRKNVIGLVCVERQSPRQQYDIESTPPVTANHPDRGHLFVGVDDFVHTASGAQLDETFLAVAPWVTDDPGIADPDLSLAERRGRLRAVGKDLLPSGHHAGQYRESVIWADLPVRTADI